MFMKIINWLWKETKHEEYLKNYPVKKKWMSQCIVHAPKAAGAVLVQYAECIRHFQYTLCIYSWANQRTRNLVGVYEYYFVNTWGYQRHKSKPWNSRSKRANLHLLGGKMLLVLNLCAKKWTRSNFLAIFIETAPGSRILISSPA